MTDGVKHSMNPFDEIAVEEVGCARTSLKIPTLATCDNIYRALFLGVVIRVVTFLAIPYHTIARKRCYNHGKAIV